MKGFIYLLEIAVTAILMVVVLSAFFAIRVKQNWDEPDLVGFGNNIVNFLNQDDNFFIRILEEDFTYIEKSKPVNVGYGLKVKGSPKSKILVGCTQPLLCNYIKSILSDAYVNGRYIKFLLEEFDIRNSIPNYLDAIVLVNYTNYTMNKQRILDYLSSGGMVLGINGTYANNDDDFNEIFRINDTSASGSINSFIAYKPSKDDIEKYFLGIGFDVGSEWYIWEERWKVNYIGSRVNITKSDGSDYNYVSEGEFFDMTGPNGNTYWFRVNKMGSGKANIQAIDIDFVFKDFSDSSDVRGVKIVGPTGLAASMTANGTAIWMSDFPRSDEYRSLAKAAIISRKDEWAPKDVYTTKEKTTVSSFFSLCCDMPEVSELEITLWYAV